MGEFKIIETQEQFDAAIKDRLDRERKTLSEKYADYDEIKKKSEEFEVQVSKLNEVKTTLEAKISENEKVVEGLNAKIKSYETDSVKTRIGLEKGLPYELIKRLTGETEEEITKDAETMAQFTSHSGAPISTHEPESYHKDEKEEALKKMAQMMSKN